MIKKIGVLTSGGDSPGMNAAVMAVAKAARYYNMSMIGIKRGYNGTAPTLKELRAELLKQEEPEAQDIALALELSEYQHLMLVELWFKHTDKLKKTVQR